MISLADQETVAPDSPRDSEPQGKTPPLVKLCASTWRRHGSKITPIRRCHSERSLRSEESWKNVKENNAAGFFATL
jgi:hypothetical protein